MDLTRLGAIELGEIPESHSETTRVTFGDNQNSDKRYFWSSFSLPTGIPINVFREFADWLHG